MTTLSDVQHLFDLMNIDGKKDRQRKPETTGNPEFKVYVVGSYRGSVTPNAGYDLDIALSLKGRPNESAISDAFRALAETLTTAHPAISTYKGIFGGTPHISGVRLTVPHVLAQVRNLGSVDAIVEFYDNTITREQVEEAISYAQRFLEVACAPLEANG